MHKPPIAFLILVQSLVLFSETVNAQYDAASTIRTLIGQMKVGPADWPQMGGSALRNCVVDAANISTNWDVQSGENVRWSAALGSTTYGNPVVANGQVYVGTNNGAGYIKRYPNTVDLGALLCFKEIDGQFLWQHSSEKLESGKKHDWPDQGICSTPLADGDRLWYVTNRGEVVCLDVNGFHDGKNDGVSGEPNEDLAEADVVWSYDMMAELGVSQRYMANCSVTCVGDLLLVCTSQGVDDQHKTADAPSFICLNRVTGKLNWSDNSPSLRVLHGQWSSPAFAELGGVGQAIFCGGDGWVYSFDIAGDKGRSNLLWRFDCNPKDTLYKVGGAGNRNHIIASPVIYDGLVYIAVGEDPEFGEGPGHLWCIDPSRQGDVSATMVFNKANPDQPIEPKRMQALVEKDGDFERDNPNSAALWHYQGSNPDEFETTMHRACGGVAIKNNLLFITDFSGLLHCLDAKAGKPHWTYDMFAACWASPLIVGDKVYASDEDGDIAIFELSEKLNMVAEINMASAVYSTPTVANETLFISTRNKLYAIQEGAQAPAK